MRRLFALGVIAVLGLAACGGGDGGDGGDEPATCSPSGSALSVTAENFAFDTDCLAAPADTDFTIELTNKDAGTPHNVAILPEDGEGDALFQGELFEGVETQTYDVNGIPAGTYHFHCDAHPDQMQGTFIVE